ncbi:MAG: diacylglycerol kinase [Firmicutes bacterium]|nr:diacylglycerol kinase [Bacillota bacterium]
MGNKNWVKVFSYAWSGVVYSIVTQRNMKVHLVAGATALLLAWFLVISPLEWAILVLTIAGVISAEIINTALEAAVDLVSPEFHPLAKRAKDTAAGAVLIMALASLAVAYIIFFKRLVG